MEAELSTIINKISEDDIKKFSSQKIYTVKLAEYAADDMKIHDLSSIINRLTDITNEKFTYSVNVCYEIIGSIDMKLHYIFKLDWHWNPNGLGYYINTNKLTEEYSNLDYFEICEVIYDSYKKLIS